MYCPLMQKILYLIVCFLLLSSCSVADDVDELKGSVGEMKDQTRHMRDRTEDIYSGTREAESINSLRQSFAEVVRGGDKEIVRKLEYAMIYFGSFEFQHWQNNYEDTLSRRDHLMAKAVELFFAQIDDLIDDSFPISVWNPSGQAYQNWLVLSVMSVAMSQRHPNQELYAKEGKFHARSMMDIIVESLSLKADILRGTKVPEYVSQVLRWEQQALYLLQLRHNFIPFMVLGTMTNFEESFFAKLRRFLPWSLDLSEANEIQIQWWNDWLRQADQTRNILQALHVKPQTNTLMKFIYSSLSEVSGLDREHNLDSTKTLSNEVRLEFVGHIEGLKRLE